MNTPKKRSEWESLAARLSINGKAFINGEYQDAVSGNTLE